MHRAQRLLSVRLRSGEEGYFLVMALILTAAVMVMAGGLAMLSTAALRAAQRNLDRARALYAAESGMNQAISAIVKEGGDPSGLADWKMLDQAISPSTTYSVWLLHEDTPCPARTVIAEGSSNGVTRRFRARIRLTTVPFPPGSPEVPTAGCEEDYADPSMAMRPIDEIVPPYGWSEWSNSISGEGPVYIKYDGTLYLTDTEVSIETIGEVNIFVKGDFQVGRNVSLTVSPGAKVNFYVYGNVVLGANKLGSFLIGSRLNVRTNDFVVFHVQKGLISYPGAAIDVSPFQRGQSEGAVVFLMSNAPADSSEPVVLGPQEGLVESAIRTGVCALLSLLSSWGLDVDPIRAWLCDEPATELAIYAPSRTVTMNSVRFSALSYSMDPNVLGSIVRREASPECLRNLDLGIPRLNRYIGQLTQECEPLPTVNYNPRLSSFELWERSRLVPGSWREERVTP